MMAEYQVKYDEAYDIFVATIGGTDYQVKWDDKNNIFVVTYSGSDYQVKWDDVNNKFVISTLANIWKLDSTPTLVWAYDTEGDATLGICVDSSGNIYVVGSRVNNKSVWELNSSGVEQWTYDTGDYTNGVAVDGSGNVFIAGDRD
jgi:hypothetical protein